MSSPSALMVATREPAPPAVYLLMSVVLETFTTCLWTLLLCTFCWNSCFQELKSVGLDLSHDAADLPVNRPKNRYTNILPCMSTFIYFLFIFTPHTKKLIIQKASIKIQRQWIPIIKEQQDDQSANNLLKTNWGQNKTVFGLRIPAGGQTCVLRIDLIINWSISS